MTLSAEGDSLPTDEKELLDDFGFVGCHSSRSNDLMTVTDMPQSLKSNLAKRQNEQSENRASDRLSSSLTLWSLR